MERWSFLTNHARVLVCIAHDPGVRLRDIAERVGITERSAYTIVTDLHTICELLAAIGSPDATTTSR